MNSAPLRLYHDIGPGSSRVAYPNETSHHFLIIGAGVIGLTTAWTLLDAGHNVTIIAKEWASWTKAQRLTSQIAGALWEYPPAVCGQHIDKISLHHSKRWAMTSYHIWDQLADPMMGEMKSGVVMRPAGFFFPRSLDENPAELQKMKELSISGVKGFCRNPALAEQHRVNPRHGIVDAYEILSPQIDTDVAMEWLMQLVAAKGAIIVTEEIQEDLLLIEDSLRARFCADAIVNCTGLGSATVANDESCYPLRGAMIRVINDGKDFPKVKAALAVSADAASDNEMVFIVPRNYSILYLGGIVQPGQKNLNLTIDHPDIKRMRARCEAFLPDFKNARLDKEYPLAQGLRPFRGRNVRVERELRWTPAGKISRVVHSYGHGGAGWSLAFGCAGDVKCLLQEVMNSQLPEPMRDHGERLLERL
ncbi:FAD dependent oxidoreductase [Diaporthe sp. PMI_573]|nr:FAD dependent oxidoreductase [Diaporthaceae sp. PMI_573]